MKKKEDEHKVLLGRVGNTLKMGIVGFPNVGKSSTFNLLSNMQVKAVNVPFSTIEPNIAKVPITDPRFNKLCDMYKPKSRVQATLTIFDIAGLVPNAHKGEGLGNQFLSNIQQVDGIFHMVRAFDDMSIVHTEVEVDPIRDLKAISYELCMKDLIAVEKKVAELDQKITRMNDAPSKKEKELLVRVMELLKESKWVVHHNWTNDEIERLNEYLFFTAKPVVYLVNLSAEDYKNKKSKYLPKIKDWIEKNCPGKIVPFSVEFEQALEQKSIEGQSSINKIIKAGYEALNLMHFFTAGEDEVREWTVRKHSKAPKAAGVIHTDFELGFICAEVMKYDDLIALGGEPEVKNAGKYKQHGKDYEVEDGDVIFFKFNPPKSAKKK